MKTIKDASETKATRLFLIIEARMLREVIASIFRKQPDFNVVDSIRYSETAYKQAASSGCDLLLADQASAAAFPPNFITDLLSLSPEKKTILFGMEDDPVAFFQV